MGNNNLRSAGVPILFGLLLVFGLGSIPLLAQANYDGDRVAPEVTGDHNSHFVEDIADLGTDPTGIWVVGPPHLPNTLPSPASFDCEPCFLGFGMDRYDFTLTSAADVMVEVQDQAFTPAGDRFEARCNNRNIDEDGDGSFNNHGEDCIFGRQLVATGGPFFPFVNLGTLTLEPGDWSIRIRDVEFQCGTTFEPDPPTIPTGNFCPAGYKVKITFSAPSLVPQECPALESCGDPTNNFVDFVANPGCLDTSGDRCPPADDPRDTGFWNRVCKRPHPSGEHENLPGYVPSVATGIFAGVSDVDDLCSELTPSPKKDKCEKAEAAYMALLLNVASGRLSDCNCVDDPELGGESTVGDAIALVDTLIATGLFDDCLRAKGIAEAINSGLCLCP